jgi:hypothetical protein
MEWANIGLMALPSIVSGVVLLRINTIKNSGEAREESRKKESILILMNLDAIGALSEQAARCLKGEKPNGVLDEALSYRQKCKHELSEHLMQVNAEYSKGGR